jgi:hypothetical protein
MRTCPFCAEAIQDAAIVCKHCQRDIVTPPPLKANGWRKPLMIVGGLAAVGFGMVYFGDDHQRFLEFDKQRDAWHRKCDAYVGRTQRDAVSAATARACQEELTALTEYAKRQGWN